MSTAFRSLLFAVIALTALTTGTNLPAHGKWVLAMADDPSQSDTSPPPADHAPSTRPAPVLRGGLVEQASPLWVIQRRRESMLIESELNKRGDAGIPNAALSERTAQIDTLEPLKAEVSDSKWLLVPEFPTLDTRHLRGYLSAHDPCNLWRPNIAEPMYDDRMQHPVYSCFPTLPPSQPSMADRQIESELASAQHPTAITFPRFPHPSARSVYPRLLTPSCSDAQPKASAEIEAALRNRPRTSTTGIDAQLQKAHAQAHVPDVDAELRAQQASARPLLDKQAGLAAAQIKAVFRRLPSTSVDLETYAKLLNRDPDSAISWDPWYAHVAAVAEPLLVHAVESCGGPAGSNTVEITVLRNHHVTVTLVHGGNTSYDNAILRAYRRLDGNRALAFPKGSCRAEVSFAADNTHIAAGEVSSVDTQPCIGDTEPRTVP